MSNDNIKGGDGFVNMGGDLNSPAFMTTVNDPNFWDYIEDGIKPLVAIFLKYNIDTFGSCQGHYVEGNEPREANLRYYTNDRLEAIIKLSLKRFDNTNLINHKELDANGRRTDRIIFNTNPKDRDVLNKLIIDYSTFLDEFLEKRIKK